MQNKRFFTLAAVSAFVLLAGSSLFLRMTSNRIFVENASKPVAAPLAGEMKPALPEKISPAAQPVVPERPVSKPVPKPKWLGKLQASHQKYYPDWKQQKSPVIALKPAGPGETSRLESVPATSPGIPAPGPKTTEVSSPVSWPSAAGVVSASGQPVTAGSRSSDFSSASGGGSSTPAEPPSQGTGGQGPGGEGSPPEEPPPASAVSVSRTLNRFDGGAYVSLNITVSGQVNGLIITETVAGGYSITSASPNYAKKKDNTYKWLLYGRTIPSQTINYEIRGTGSGSVSGSFNSNSGNGNTTGDSLLGG